MNRRRKRDSDSWDEMICVVVLEYARWQNENGFREGAYLAARTCRYFHRPLDPEFLPGIEDLINEYQGRARRKKGQHAREKGFEDRKRQLSAYVANEVVREAGYRGAEAACKARLIFEAFGEPRGDDYIPRTARKMKSIVAQADAHAASQPRDVHVFLLSELREHFRKLLARLDSISSTAAGTN